MKFWIITIVLLSSLLLFSCKEKCEEPISEEEFSLITPKEIYQVGFKKQSSKDLIVIENYAEFEEVLLGEFGYSGNYRYNEASDLVIGIGVYLDHLLYEPLEYDIRKYEKGNEIEVVIKVKERYQLVKNNPGYRWIWVNIPKSNATVKAVRNYEFIK
jgi:hypothetical protein